MTRTRITLEDVARAAGVSVATVDRVVNQRGGVASDKEAAILREARRLGLDRKLAIRPTAIKRIGVLIQPPSNPFHAQLREGIEQARAIYRDLSLQLQIEHIDPTRPHMIAAQIVRMGAWADGLILTVPASPDIVEAIQSLPERVPVVTMADDVPGCRRAAFIGPDDEKSGRVAGDLMGTLIGREGGEVLVLIGRYDMPGHSARAEGFAQVLAERHPTVRVMQVIETHEDKAAAATLALQALRKNARLRGVYLCSTGSAEITAVLPHTEIAVITHELTATRRALLKARKLQAVIDQKPILEARLAVETIAHLIGRLEGQAGSIATDIQIFMPESV